MHPANRQRVISRLILATALAAGPLAARETNLYWGDTHLHTGNSFDVYLFGTTESTPETALRFASGQPVISPTTQVRMQLSRPLDFVVVSDHAEAMGSVARLFAGDPAFTDTRTGKLFLELARIIIVGEYVLVSLFALKCHFPLNARLLKSEALLLLLVLLTLLASSHDAKPFAKSLEPCRCADGLLPWC